MKLPTSVYLHVPFCIHRCGYCDFTLVAGKDELIPAYLQGLSNELRTLPERLPMKTIFVGGGTPTYLEEADLQQLLQLIDRHFVISESTEFCIEANPDGLTDQKLKLLADAGVNRLSLGVQSFDAGVLKTLERHHSPQEAISVVENANQRIQRVSLDLIFAVPGQTQQVWEHSLQTAIGLPVGHLSTYGLTYEKGTEFYARVRDGQLKSLPEEAERSMFETAIDQLAFAGFEHYEISSFAKPEQQCQHNHVYWNADEYLAFGPGAARYVDGTRTTNARSVHRWIKNWQKDNSAIQETETLTKEQKIREAVFLGLRKIQGINVNEFCDRWKVDFERMFETALHTNMEGGFLKYEDGILQLTREGIFVADSIVSDFL